MQSEFWLHCWQQQRTGFHQYEIHPLLPVVISQLSWDQSKAVFAPLSGKSLDLWWLARYGKVIGAELSELACQQFYQQQNQSFSVSAQDDFQYFSHQSVDIWQGDYFALKPEQVADIGLIYDRAALIALPAQMRIDYVQQLKALCPGPVSLVLLSLEYPEHEMSGPPFSVTEQEVRQLFDFASSIELLAMRNLTGRLFAQRQFNVSKLVEKAFWIQW
ncbi:MAG: thiopurine S-methyltransferase [Gammaproteobacteria bacterium]|nr:thiopurine S-methyltransferase [Gammaproteobacteria bacterium]MBU2058542.1 thiopurine S-methyltransferase [Gammaproteobacteria bacterium]MBU2175567.1 thiopurine S-methyltransferase [Gammaproteobacteria bacterium]MBU2248653.1 thiopurine S-methyltransferase [Gammaproteobacteria bacterium]MBU2344808.1 thiopurine S-methyltransferase [Gammaproteobacteria bacterium]